jgi:hypothetical protein
MATKVWLTGPDVVTGHVERARALRERGYQVTSVYECPESVGLDDLRASLSWVCAGVINADLVVTLLPGYPSHGVELTLADALDIPVVDIDEALSVGPERLLA